MITARFYRDNGRFAGFHVGGHAGFDDTGRDIACASVTSAVQTAANTITEVLLVRAGVTAGNAVVELKLPDHLPPNEAFACEAVLKGLQLQCSVLAGQFPGCIEVEVLENQKGMNLEDKAGE